MNNPSPLFDIRDLRKTYENGTIQALAGVDLTINAGDFVSISGSSGSGKSTLLQLLGGLDTRHRGATSTSRASAWARRSISTATARPASASSSRPSTCCLRSPRSRTCRSPGWAARQAGKIPPPKPNPYCARWVSAIVCCNTPASFSAGERQRVAIARSLANNPEVLLADEPTGNLDSVNTGKIMEILTGLQRSRNMTLILVTHEDAIARIRFRATSA